MLKLRNSLRYMTRALNAFWKVSFMTNASLLDWMLTFSSVEEAMSSEKPFVTLRGGEEWIPDKLLVYGFQKLCKA